MQQSSTHAKPNTYLTLAIAISLLLIGYFFSIRGINQDVVRYDEQTTLGHIGALDDNGLSLSETIQSLQTTSTQHPPLYFLVANIWGRLASYTVFSQRLLSVLISMLALASVYRFARDLGGAQVASYTLFINATSVLYVFYTHDLRQYMVLMLCVSIMLLMYHRLAHSTTPLKLPHLALLSLTALGAIYAHYSALFVLVPIGVYHLLFAPKNRAWLQISVAMLVAGLLFTPWIPTVIEGKLEVDQLTEDNQIEVFSNQEVAQEAVIYWGNGEPAIFFALMGLSLIAIGFSTAGSRKALFFVVAMAITIGIMNEYLQFVERMRYIIVFAIPFSVFAGFGLTLLHKRRILLPIIPLILGAWVIIGTNFQTTDEFRDQTQTIVTTGYFVELNHLVPLLKTMETENSILVPVIFHYGMTRNSKQGKTSIEDYYLADVDIPYTNLYSGRIARDPFDLDGLTTAVQGYSSILLTYPIHDMYHIRKFVKAIKDDYTLCQTIEYGANSILERYVLSTEFEAHCVED